MSGTPYIEQDLLDEASDALKVPGNRLEDIAGRLGACPNVLAQLLPLPALRPIPVDDDVNLWADEEALESVL